MKIITTVKEMQAEISKQKAMSKSIGFVPTMGFLHEGHLTLMKQARQENDIVVISIFVNPTQFGPNEDYETYPRDFERDRKVAIEAKIDYLFYPSVEEMYPNPPSIKVLVNDRVDVLCGKSRPGHFDGVATVLIKLFNIMMPTRAYFGKKDAQQVAVVDGLISDFHFPIELVPVDIVREEDGLAKSSRNVKLTSEERKQAPVLYKSLEMAKAAIMNGERNPSRICDLIAKVIHEETSGTIDYVEVYSYPNLKQLEKIAGSIIIAIAVKFSTVRLIDNVMLKIN
ncbi:MAG TPA: pantoate--beta-alanine ligase [Bacillales bacterium]|nr:pantoate--beta-alanine ligase [Bacillales bacterium]